VNLGAARVDVLKFSAPPDVLCGAESQDTNLLAADGQPLAALGATTLDDEPAVLRGHADEKPMRALAMARVGLKCADTLCHDDPFRLKRTFNVSERLREVSIFEECVTVGVLHQVESIHGNSMQPLVSPQSFPHLWKKLWKFADLTRGESEIARIYWCFLQSLVGRCEKPGVLVGRKPAESLPLLLS
jgi:hypothetical protein